MVKQEIIIDQWNASYFDTIYDDKTKERKSILDRKKQIPTDIFINRVEDLTKINSISNDMLPLNCRYSTELQKYKLFVIEEPPQMRNMFLNYDMSMIVATLKASGELKKFGYEKWFEENKKPYRFYLAFPYIIYFITLDRTDKFVKLKVFSRVTPLTSLADYLCKLPLMNINGNQTVCTGSLVNFGNEKGITDIIQKVIKTFWVNIFNKDYIYNVQAYNNIPFVCDYLTWQYYSQTDPMFIYNVEWIPYKTIGFEISNFKSGYTREENFPSLKMLIDKVFYKPSLTNKKVKKTDENIYDNMADSINLNGMPIFVNDSFILKKKRYFVRSFMAPKSSSSLTHIKLQDPDKKTTIHKLTKEFKSLLRRSIIKERFIQSTTLKNGTVIKQGSIIKSTNAHGNEVYNKITYMRYGLDGKIEARMKSSLTALEDMKNIKVINLKKIKIDGIKLEIDKTYTILYDYNHFYSDSSVPVKILKEMKFNDIDVSSSGVIITKFEDIKNYDKYTINLEDLNNKLIDEKKLKSIPSICRMGTSLITNTNIKIHSNMTNFLIMNSTSINMPNYNDTMDVILKDKQHLFIESFDMNLSFKIGDKVVTSNWINPIEMLKVKTITGFKTKDNNLLNVLLVDQHGNKTEHTYLHRDTYSFIVCIGTLRHIEKEYDGITSGTKIKANKAGFFNFPIKDTNIIIGFLTDTGGNIPLALCSNGATIWGDDLKENFNLITMSNKKWKSLKHTPIINQRKFKFQPGDITTIPYNSNKYTQNLLTVQYLGDKLINQYLSDENAFSPRYSGYFNTEVKNAIDRIGFLNPRYSQKQLTKQKFINAYPNFHGMYNFNPTVRTKYYVDERRILNVSDLLV